jgi:hypothetical protein
MDRRASKWLLKKLAIRDVHCSMSRATVEQDRRRLRTDRLRGSRHYFAFTRSASRQAHRQAQSGK